MIPRIAVLALSDSFSDVWAQLAAFAGAEIEVARTVGEIHALPSTCGVVLSVAGMEDRCVDVLHELQAAQAPDSVVVGTETGYRVVATILQGGAVNYFAMPGDLGLCRSWMVDRVERFVDRQKGQSFAADERARFDFSQMIGNSPLLQASLRRTSKVIPKGSPTVLITGETGTGKELLARAVHYNSPRSAAPFVEINCTTLPENLLETELFGYEPGAFSDAKVSKQGLFEVADGGTMFLDEIGDLSPGLQAKLLRVLEEKRVRRLGGVRDVSVDVRIVAATHVDLPSAIQSGRFRQDLFYRLSVFPIWLPPLRERGEDVFLLAEHFLSRFAREYEIRPPGLTPDIRRALRSHNWPGNVRELRNSIERAVLLGDGNLFVEDLFPQNSMPASSSGELPFPAPMQLIEKAAARAMVTRCGGNKSEAAKALAISRKHLYTLLAAEEGT
jgi:DNA-binding NtrC family response regulator